MPTHVPNEIAGKRNVDVTLDPVVTMAVQGRLHKGNKGGDCSLMIMLGAPNFKRCFMLHRASPIIFVSTKRHFGIFHTRVWLFEAGVLSVIPLHPPPPHH